MCAIIRDIYNHRWAVREFRETKHGFPIAFGYRLEDWGLPSLGGSWIIITHPLRRYLESIRMRPSDADLPIGVTALTRLRRDLGHHHERDMLRFYKHHRRDLRKMTDKEFGAKFGIEEGAVRRYRQKHFGRKARQPGWYNTPEIRDLFLGGESTAELVSRFKIGESNVYRIRRKLREINPAE